MHEHLAGIARAAGFPRPRPIRGAVTASVPFPAPTLASNAGAGVVVERQVDAGEDLGPSFFEVTIAAAFLAFSRTPADACVVEVGLGGRFDATNVLEPEVLAACGIAALGIDHERFLPAPPRAPGRRG